MDFNPRFSPSDWLLVQRKEFYKERDLRWKCSYDKIFWDNDRYGGGAQEDGPLDLRDLLKLQREGTLNPLYDQLPGAPGGASGSRDTAQDSRSARGLSGSKEKALRLPLNSVPRDVTPVPTFSPARVMGSGRSPSPLVSGGNALTGSPSLSNTFSGSHTRIDRSTTRMEPVRTWQADAEKYPAMKHAASDSVLARVYTASAGHAASASAAKSGASWQSSMTQPPRGRVPDVNRIGGDKRSGAFGTGVGFT